MGTDRPTLDTVAEAAGVSRMTVSNAYNRPDQLSAATRERVLAVAAALGYAGPDPAGRSLRRGRTGSIGVVITESLSYALNDPGLVSFLRGVADELSPSGRSMLLIPTDADTGGGIVRDAIVDAFITCALDADDPAVAAVRSRGLPWATVGNPRLPGVPFLGIDNRAAARLAAEHLLSLGHRRLAVVGVPPRMPVAPEGTLVPSRPGFAQRIDGFLGAVADHGLDPADVVVVHAATNDTGAAAEAVAPLLAGRGRPTAIFTVSDVLALGVLSAARAQGLDVPGGLSVVGFDGIVEGERSTPPLTTVAQDLRAQGRHAAHIVLGLLAGEKRRAPRTVPQLVVRGSTAAPRR